MPESNLNSLQIERFDERFILDAQSALYWKRKRWLVVSDIHLGKAMHFRKKGFAIPGNLDARDLGKLEGLISRYRPHRVILLGDLFHSDYNSDWERFAAFTQRYRKGLFILVRGNHDILPDWHYGRSRMQVVEELRQNNLWFTHHPQKEDHAEMINICGHVHPGVRLFGRGRQSLRLPAFFLRKNSILMPAFGRFTGAVSIKPEDSDLVYAIAEEQLVEISRDFR